MEDNDNSKNEIAATLFSVLLGLGVILIASWLSLGKGCSGRDSDPSGREIASEVSETSPEVESEISSEPGPDTETVIEGPVIETDGNIGEEAELEEIEARLLQAKADRHSAERELAELKEKVDGYDGKLDAKQEETLMELAAVQSRYDALDARAKKLATDLASANEAKVELAAIEKEQAALKTELSKSKTKISEISRKLADAAAVAATAKAATGAGKEDVEKALADNKKLKARIEGLEKEKVDLGNTITRLKTDVDAVSKKMAATNTNSEAKIQKLTSENKGLSDEIAKLKAAGEKMKGEVSSLAAVSTANKELTAEFEKLKTAASRMSRDSSERIKKLTLDNRKLSEEITKLKAESNAMKSVNSEKAGKLEAENKSLSAQIESLKSASGKMKQDSAAQIKKLASDNKNLSDEIAKLKAASAKMTEESTAQAGKLTAENKKLSDEVAKLKAAAAKMSGASAEEIKTLAADNKNLAEEIEKLKTAATKMGGDSAERIRNLTGENKQLSTQIANLTRSVAQVKKLATDNKRLSDEIAKLKADAGKMAASSKRIESLTAENKKLASELSGAKERVNSISRQLAAARSGDRLKPAASLPELNLPFLINDPAKLDSEMIPLFAELRGIEDDPEARTAAYGGIRKQGKATPLKVVKFDPGSSEVGDDDKTSLRNLPDNDGAKYLVVGYASVDGDPDTNARLSSRRASEVARQIAANGKNKNRVQAVYFGQTNRFSKAYRSPNRIVEVWRIEK